MSKLDELIQQYQPILDQLGEVNLSKSHKKNYKLQEPDLADLMNHNITPAVFKDNTRHGGKDNVERILNYMILDHDGTMEELITLLQELRASKVSYLTWASPSRKNKLSINLFKTRIIIPTIGLTKGMYAKQFLQLLIELGQEIDIRTDETAQEITRFFYPPNMESIREPHIKIDGKWLVLNPKPRNQSQMYALESVTGYLGEPYTAKRRFTQAMTQKIEEKQSFAYSEKESVYLPDDMEITHCGIGLGTFADLISYGVHQRCDCPFDGEHGTSSKEDSAFISNGHVICSSNSHAHLIGRPANQEIRFLDIEEV